MREEIDGYERGNKWEGRKKERNQELMMIDHYQKKKRFVEMIIEMISFSSPIHSNYHYLVVSSS